MYALLCLSHDPAIVIENPEFHSGNNGRQTVEGLLAFDAAPIAGHESCDVMAGAYSYPLVEVYLPARTRHGWSGWIDAYWLQLLYGAYEAGADIPHAINQRWTRERVRRLRYELRCEIETVFIGADDD